MMYVITCGDEGVQVNEGTRLGILGSGVKLEGSEEVIAHLKALYGENIVLAANDESDWVRKQFDLPEWEQTNATYQQQAQVLADKTGVPYAGFIEFTDPRKLTEEIKAHMVRPRKIHIANKICFTLGGGEQTYNLGCFVVSAEWVHLAKPECVKEFMETQINFYKELVKMEDMVFKFEEAGELGEEIVEKNKAVLREIGIFKD